MLNKMTPVIKGLAIPFKILARLIKKSKKPPNVRVIRDHNLIVKKLSIDDLTNRKQDERRIQELIGAKDGLALIGEKDGSIDVPNHSTTQEAPTIKEWEAKCRSTQNEIISPINYKSIEMEKRLLAMKASFEEQTMEERIDFHVSQQSKKIQKKFRRPFRGGNNQYTIREVIDQITQEIRDEVAEQNALIKRVYHQVRPKKGLTDYTWVYVLFLFGISSGEFPLNVTGLQALGELSNGFVLILSAFFALIMGFSAHAAGHAFFKKHRGEWVAAVSIGLVLCIMVGVLRSQLHGSIMMSLMNVLIFFFGCYISYERAKNIAFWSSDRRVKRLQRKKMRLEILLRRVMDEFRAEATKEVREQLDELKQFIDVEAVAVSTIEAYKENIIKRIEGICNEGVAIYRNANSLSRKRVGHPEVKMWQHDNSTVNYHNQNSSGSFYNYTKLIALLVSFCSLMACGSSHSNEAVILFDTTDPRAISTVDLEEVPNYLFEEVLGLPNAALKSQGLNVCISCIGSTSIQYVEKVELKSGGSFLGRTDKKREEVIEGFKEALHSNIQKIAKTKSGFEQTVLMENLCGHLNTLALSKAPKKGLIIFSDLLHHTKSISFYHYRNKPSQIMDNYGTLAAKMDNVCSLPSLNNITIAIVYLPTEANDQLFQYTKAFWTQYFREYGATVIFSPNI